MFCHNWSISCLLLHDLHEELTREVAIIRNDWHAAQIKTGRHGIIYYPRFIICNRLISYPCHIRTDVVSPSLALLLK